MTQTNPQHSDCPDCKKPSRMQPTSHEHSSGDDELEQI